MKATKGPKKGIESIGLVDNPSNQNAGSNRNKPVRASKEAPKQYPHSIPGKG